MRCDWNDLENVFERAVYDARISNNVSNLPYPGDQRPKLYHPGETGEWKYGRDRPNCSRRYLPRPSPGENNSEGTVKRLCRKYRISMRRKFVSRVALGERKSERNGDTASADRPGMIDKRNRRPRKLFASRLEHAWRKFTVSPSLILLHELRRWRRCCALRRGLSQR